MSKISSKHLKESYNQKYFPQTRKKIISRNNLYEIKIGELGAVFPLQFIKRKDSNVFKYREEGKPLLNKSLRMLANAIKSSNKIQRIDIKSNFYGSLIDDQSLLYLTEELKRLKSFHFFNLDLGRSNITDEGLKNIGECFKRLGALQSLNLSLYNCKRISDKGLESLSEGFKRLRLLQSIKLSFRYCDQITNKGFQQISEVLKRLGFLKSVSLEFNGHRITDSFLTHLGQSLNRLTSLQDIYLNFNLCFWITDEGVDQLIKALQKNSCLQSFGLIFLKLMNLRK